VLFSLDVRPEETCHRMSRRDSVLLAHYRVRAEASAVEGRSKALAVEQSVEMPLEAIADQRVLDDVVAKIQDIVEVAPGQYRVTLALALEATTVEVGQIFNMLFGNSSLHDDVSLEDVTFPEAVLQAFPGPRVGIAGLRRAVGAARRAFTASALKPIGLPSQELARLADGLARGGIDIVKDDHGLANQVLSPFRERVPAIAEAVRRANAVTGYQTLYAPSLSGHLDQLREELAIARSEGLGAVLVAPMVMGLPTFSAIAREADGLALLAHPSLGGAQRMAPPFLFGKIFRLLGADATIFPNYGGRFSYGRDICLGIAERAREPWGSYGGTLPMPAGGMTLDRVPEMLDVYGQDSALLIGGALLAARDNLTQAAAAFRERVERHGQV
jgi:ribulose-bisphosphate carboxylase large chain